MCANALRTGDRTTDCALQSAKSSCRSTCWQHVISRCYDSLKRSSGEWKEACTFSSGAWSGAPALHLRAQCTYQEKSEHEHRRTRHKRRALSRRDKNAHDRSTHEQTTHKRLVLGIFQAIPQIRTDSRTLAPRCSGSHILHSSRIRRSSDPLLADGYDIPYPTPSSGSLGQGCAHQL